ncbi:unnamed protein product [[Candida] boidinii]|uniref:Unnamed protein product n=1 Tax=Candida boidinii TaxID=5477 RepID=A0A9W6TCK4_CANBO|nr:hypothetical protein B5S30_g2846 [[Candida] boidinii]OWB83379.1 hypothetical protein B5S33_g2008 [[Candida] boidinii]GME85488.1 unnamed protein product [[Candida] boidinii]
MANTMLVLAGVCFPDLFASLLQDKTAHSASKIYLLLLDRLSYSSETDREEARELQDKGGNNDVGESTYNQIISQDGSVIDVTPFGELEWKKQLSISQVLTMEKITLIKLPEKSRTNVSKLMPFIAYLETKIISEITLSRNNSNKDSTPKFIFIITHLFELFANYFSQVVLSEENEESVVTHSNMISIRWSEYNAQYLSLVLYRLKKLSVTLNCKVILNVSPEIMERLHMIFLPKLYNPYDGGAMTLKEKLVSMTQSEDEQLVDPSIIDLKSVLNRWL